MSQEYLLTFIGSIEVLSSALRQKIKGLQVEKSEVNLSLFKEDK